MYPYLLSSNNYPSIPRHGYGYHHEPATRSLNPRDRYFNALAEARAAEEEMILAEAAPRREEELLQRRLNELRQPRLPQYSSYPLESYYDVPPRRPINNHLESLRLQVEEEERQLAKLEVARRRRLELEEEKARRQEFEEKLALRRRLAAVQTSALIDHCPQAATGVCPRRNAQPVFPTYPEPRQISREKVQPQNIPELFVRLLSEEPKPARKPVEQAKLPLPRKSEPELRGKQQPSASGQPITLNPFLQQLGFYLPATDNCPQEAGTSLQTKVQNAERPKAPKQESAPKVPTPPNTNSAPVFDLGQLFNLLASGGQDPQQEQKKQPSPPAPEVPRPKSPQTTLKEDLEQRLNNEHANEVRDTIQAILNSLRPQSAPAHQSSAPAASTSTKPQTFSSDKGKLKQVHFTIIEPESPSPKDALERVRAIENRFHALESEFAFPAKLDFVPTTAAAATSGPAASHLAYTANNQPFRYYQQSLTQLLTQLDSVESLGNDELRNKRKEVVRKVEHALEDLEQEVEGRWNAKVARESKKRSVTIEDVTSEEPFEVIPVPQITKEESQPLPLIPIPSTPPVLSTPLPSETVEESSGTGVTEESYSIENPDTPAVPQETPVPQAEGAIFDAETEAVEVVEVEEIQAQPVNHPEPEVTEQTTEEPSTATAPSLEPISPAPISSSPPAPAPVDLIEQEDLDATIQLPVPVVEDAPKLDDTDSLVSAEDETKESETDDDDEGAFLLREGLEEEKSVKRDFSDVESVASEWSELDAA